MLFGDVLSHILHFSGKRGYVAVNIRFGVPADRKGIEVAVTAFGAAERNMDVDAGQNDYFSLQR
jgi:hypothetical protein